MIATDFSSDPVSTGIVTKAALTTTKAVDVVSLYEDQDWTLGMDTSAAREVERLMTGACTLTTTVSDIDDDGPPCLVGESDDEDFAQYGEIHSVLAITLRSRSPSFRW